MNSVYINRAMSFATAILVAYMVLVLFQVIPWQYRSYGLSMVAFAGLVVSFLFLLFRHIHHKKYSAIMIVATVTYIVWVFMSDSVPYSDFSVFQRHARTFATDPGLAILHESKTPTTVLFYSVFQWLGEGSLIASQIGSVVAYLSCGILLRATLVNFGVSERKALFASVVFLFSPSILFYSPLPSSEAVFALLLFSGLWLLSRSHSSKQPASGDLFMVGTCLGLLFLTRSNGIVMLVGVLAYLFACGVSRALERREIFRQTIIVIVPFVAMLLLHGAMAKTVSGEFNVTGSPWGAYNLMTGTNMETSGGYSREDLRLAGYKGEDAVGFDEASRRALEIAGQRIMADPARFLKFALTDKIERLWSTDTQSLNWALAKSPVKAEMERRGIYSLLSVLTDAYYLVVLGTFALCLLFIWKTVPVEVGTLVVLPMLGMAFLHIFIEVQPRYHFPFMLFMLPFSGLCIVGMADKWLHGRVQFAKTG